MSIAHERDGRRLGVLTLQGWLVGWLLVGVPLMQGVGCRHFDDVDGRRLRQINTEWSVVCSQKLHFLHPSVVNLRQLVTKHVSTVGGRNWGAYPSHYFSLYPESGAFEVSLHGASAASLSAILGLPVTYFMTHSSNLGSLLPLQGMRLTRCSIDDNTIQNLDGLEGMPLKKAFISGDALTNIDALAETSLEELDFRDTGGRAFPSWIGKLDPSLFPLDGDLIDLRPISRIATLRRLTLPRARVESLEFLRGMTNLQELYLDSEAVTDLSPLTNMRLQALVIENAAVTNLDVLRGMPLQYLDVSGSSVSNFAFLRGMSLQSFACENTGFEDCTLLDGMPLESVRLFGTRVVDLAPLGSMRLERVSFTPRRVTNGVDAIRKMTSLEKINGWYPPGFWRCYDAGWSGDQLRPILADD